MSYAEWGKCGAVKNVSCPAFALLHITHQILSPYIEILTHNNLRTTNILSYLQDANFLHRIQSPSTYPSSK